MLFLPLPVTIQPYLAWYCIPLSAFFLPKIATRATLTWSPYADVTLFSLLRFSPDLGFISVGTFYIPSLIYQPFHIITAEHRRAPNRGTERLRPSSGCITIFLPTYQFHTICWSGTNRSSTVLFYRLVRKASRVSLDSCVNQVDALSFSSIIWSEHLLGIPGASSAALEKLASEISVIFCSHFDVIAVSLSCGEYLLLSIVKRNPNPPESRAASRVGLVLNLHTHCYDHWIGVFNDRESTKFEVF